MRNEPSDSELMDFMDLLFITKGLGTLNMRYDEGPTIWTDSNHTKESDGSRAFKETPIVIFTIPGQHQRAGTVREALTMARQSLILKAEAPHE